MLCQKYPSNVKNGKIILRYTLVGQAYRRIRNVILTNQLVMEKISIQLVEINQATLTRWHNDRSKQQEREVLEQGLCDCVGPDNVSGYGKVHNLAAYLLGLRDQQRKFDSIQSGTNVKLWSLMSEFDKRPTVFEPRSFLGKNSRPAQRPDANRYMEAVVEKLCNIFPANTTVDGVCISRWSLIQTSYQHIRPLVLKCSTIITNTGIQLVDINQATLTNWYEYAAHPAPIIPAPIAAIQTGSISVEHEQQVPIPSSTMAYRRKRQHLEETGDVKGPRYKRKTGTTCGQCGMERVAPSHRQYYGGVTLPVLRCARGSTSLESFHLHVNKFIPGFSANDVHFQAYLLEGLAGWNKDRAASVVGSSTTTYDSRLVLAINQLSQGVLGKPMNASYSVPNKYTGEKIGIEYLYSQTGKVLQEVDLDEEEDKEEDEDTDDEGFHETDVIDRTIFAVENDIVEETPPDETPQDEIPPDEIPEKTSSLEQDDESAGPDGVEGYGKVAALAEFLLQLEICSSLTNGQAQQVIELWSKLSTYDKKAVTFSPRHRRKLTQGRFKSSKSSTTVPGVDSTKRHNDRSKQQEREVLEQGLPTIEATVTTSKPIPAIVPIRPTMLPVPNIRSPHQFVLPQNTIGQARTRPQPHIQPPHIQPPQIPQFQINCSTIANYKSPSPQQFTTARRVIGRRKAKKHWLANTRDDIKRERPQLSVRNVARIELVHINNITEIGIALPWARLTNSGARSLEKTETEQGQLPKQGEVYLLVGGPPCQGYRGLNLYRNGEKTETEQGQLPKQGDVYLLVGGPPCQGYSGLNLYRNGEKTETEQGQLPKQGEVYLLVGGPPCQGYSGLNLYRNGEKTEIEQESLSRCIFEWDQQDLESLYAAKKSELVGNGVKNPSSEAVRSAVGKKELAQHCRRRTRGVETTESLLDSLFTTMATATDELGVPLFREEMMTEFWPEQRRHIPCIQDPPGIQLYTESHGWWELWSCNGSRYQPYRRKLVWNDHQKNLEERILTQAIPPSPPKTALKPLRPARPLLPKPIPTPPPPHTFPIPTVQPLPQLPRPIQLCSQPETSTPLYNSPTNIEVPKSTQYYQNKRRRDTAK
ncbi:Hypothetical predicted protein [Paramuricea clavata]|uniref:Uncharacterized protein n=1 Tax=Paramuricea clavata TaxID=317549 RepID=A0A6S7H3L7_PARCT|nr:Hypothetical predicted protein [Paramuricea clavata]